MKALTVLITGSRHWSNRRRIVEKLLEYPDDTTIIHGDCKTGADMIADAAAKAIGFRVMRFPAKWNWNHGHLLNPEAGPQRNRVMLNQQPDEVIAFHEDLSKSKGTKDCVEEALRRGMKVTVINE